jgi:hypothetical protein
MLTVERNPAFKEGSQISLKTMGKLSKGLERTLSKREHEAGQRNTPEHEKCGASSAGGGAGGGEDGGADGGASGVGGAADELLKDALGNEKVNGMHELAAALIQRAESSGSSHDAELTKGLYTQQFCVTDMLPLLASHGLLVEIGFVRELLMRELADDLDGAARGGAVPPVEVA